MTRTWTVLAAVFAAAACSSDAPVQQTEPGILQVTTAPGVSIEVVDWGGSGNPPLVFLAGGGHAKRRTPSASSSEDSASRTVDRCPV